MTSTIEPTGLRIEELSADLWRIELPLPFEDLTVVNCYALGSADGITLVDPGWSSEVGEATLIAGLSRIGAAPGDVRRSLVTHGHPDHLSLAISWQQRYGVPVHLGADERPSVAGFSPENVRFPRQADLLVRAGDPVLAARIRTLPLEDYEATMAFGEPAVWVADGDRIDCEGEVVIAHGTPGHTRGHVVYEHGRTGALLTGDHVLPRITPAIALELEPEELPLAAYLDSLALLLGRADAAMLPAHGPVTDSVHDRVRELIAHHDDRFDTVLREVRAGRRTAAEIAAAMTWTRRERGLDELSEVHRMTAVLEVLAHLDVLADRGLVDRETGPGQDRFTIG